MKRPELRHKKFRSFNIYGKPQFFKWSGEFRTPKAGEYFISGAIPEVYLAENDLSQEYYIAVPVPDPPKTITIRGFTYHLGV